MTKAEILDKVCATFAHNNYAEFARILNEKYSTVTSWKYRDNKLPVEKIAAKCVGVNINFLLTGEGPVLQPTHDKNAIDKITKATNELLIVCAELKNQISDIRKELEEERRQHQATTSLLNRVLDLYAKRMDVDYIKRAEDEYRTLAAESEQTNTHEAV